MNLLSTTTKTALKLYEFQANAQQSSISEFLGNGAWRQLGVLPTGTGKTVVFSTLPLHVDFRRYLATFPRDQRKILVIAHRNELLTQAKEKYERYNPTLNVQIEQAGQWADPDADVIIASIQTLSGRQGKRLGRFNKKQIRMVVCDEAHHASATTYMGVFKYFGFLPPDTFMPKTRPMDVVEATSFQRERLNLWDAQGKPPCLLLGVTATPNRSDRVGLEAVFQKIVFQETLQDMIKQGYLCRLHALRIDSNVNLDAVHTRMGDFDESELYAAINNVERNRIIVKAWLEHAEGEKTIVFAGNVQYAKDLADEFNAAGRRFAAIHGGSKDRQQLLTAFSSGKLEGLVNCNILTEGYDEPNVRCVVHARPTKSASLYTQMTGRGTRLAPGKNHCLILDIVDVTSRHSLQTAPTLFGLPTDYDAQGKDLVEDADTIAKMVAANPLLDTASARSMDELEARATVVDLFGAFQTPEILENSKLAWMRVGEMYQLTYPGPKKLDETLSIQPNDLGSYDVRLRVMDAQHESTIGAPADSIEAAFAIADNFITTQRHDQLQLCHREAAWKTKPITARQESYLSYLETAMGLKPTNKSGLTSGQAANLIDLYHSRP